MINLRNEHHKNSLKKENLNKGETFGKIFKSIVNPFGNQLRKNVGLLKNEETSSVKRIKLNNNKSAVFQGFSRLGSFGNSQQSTLKAFLDKK